jgi:Ca2+/Na+ antiporter
LTPTLVSWLQTDRYLLSTLQEDEDDEDGDKESKPLPTRTQIITRAVLYLIAGAAIAAIFSDPLVDAIGGFSKASGIPPFFIAFIATPLATNSSEAISSILFARGKRKRNISMTYSQVCCIFPGNRHLDQSESQPTI